MGERSRRSGPEGANPADAYQSYARQHGATVSWNEPGSDGQPTFFSDAMARGATTFMGEALTGRIAQGMPPGQGHPGMGMPAAGAHRTRVAAFMTHSMGG